MKILINDANLDELKPEEKEKVYPYFTLLSGVTITHKAFMDVLNEDILESPKVREAIEAGLLRIEEMPE